MLKIDGSYLEGGGQICRNALALSTLTGIPFEIDNIRLGREQPGLKNQHLHAIKTLKILCGAETNEVAIGSTFLKYEPKAIKAKNFDMDLGTAGSITLLLQSVLMPLLFANKSSSVKFTGGTDTIWSLPFDYFKEVYLPHLEKYCKKVEVNLLKRGYYPKGGGEVEVKVTPKYKVKDFSDFGEFHKHLMEEVPKIHLIEKGDLMQIRGVCHASKDLADKRVVERIVDAAENKLKKKFKVPINIRREYCNSYSTGCGITLYALFANEGETSHLNPVRVGADCLGSLGKSSEKVGEEAADKLIDELSFDAPVDRHLADNLVPWLIFGGRLKATEVTNHAKTNAWVTNKFFADLIEIKENVILNSQRN